LSPTEGIVDAFEYDVSLTKAAHEIDRVFFIAAGTVTAHAGDLFANPRWRKLHGGFRSEDALLLLYLSAGALARLSTVPDGLIVLSADGYEPESSIGQGITAAMERGIPLLGVVRERWTPLATPAPPPARPQPRLDSLAWTVQLAAYARLDRALALADRLAADGITPFVTPVTLGPRRGGTVWYRVLAGGYRTRDSAVAVRATLWSRRLAQRGQGDVLRAPYSYAVKGTAAADDLRARGIPALARDRDGHLLVGAFETPEQAGGLEGRPKRAGIG